MEAHEQKAAPVSTLLEDWSVYQTIFPKFYDLIEPTATTAPEILDLPEVREALCAVLLVNIDAFRYSAPDIPILSDERVFALWHKTHHYWRRRRHAAYRMISMDGTTAPVWPLLLRGLRGLEPTVPKLAEGAFLLDDVQFRLRRAPRTWAYLSAVAHLLEMLRHTHKPKD